MALSRLTSGTLGAEGNPASSITLTWPTSGITTSSLAVLVVNLYENGNDTNANSPGAGWVLQTTSTGDVIAGSGTTQTKTFVFTRACDGNESGSLVITNSAGTSIYWGAMLDVYNGTNDLTFASISSPNIASSSNDATAPSVSGTSGQGLICVYGLDDGDTGATNSGPSGMSQGSNNPHATAAGCPTRNYYVTLSSTAATGTKTWDFTNAHSSASYSLLVDGAGATAGALKIAAIAQSLNVILG